MAEHRIRYAWMAKAGQIVVIHSERKPEHDGKVGVVHASGKLDGTVTVMIPDAYPEGQTLQGYELEPVGSLADYTSAEGE